MTYQTDANLYALINEKDRRIAALEEAAHRALDSIPLKEWTDEAGALRDLLDAQNT